MEGKEEFFVTERWFLLIEVFLAIFFTEFSQLFRFLAISVLNLMKTTSLWAMYVQIEHLHL